MIASIGVQQLPAPMKKTYPIETVLSLTTGVLLKHCGFGEMHELAEYVLGHSIWTHEFADRAVWARLRAAVFAQHPELREAEAFDSDEAKRALDTYLPAYVERARLRFGADVEIEGGTARRTESPLASAARLMLGKTILGVMLILATACSSQAFSSGNPADVDAGHESGEETAAAGEAGASAKDAGAEIDSELEAAPACAAIAVTGATFGESCGAPTPLSSVATQCNGKNECAYVFDWSKDPGLDPAPGCWKDVNITYDCVDVTGNHVRSDHVEDEMAWQYDVLVLDCC